MNKYNAKAHHYYFPEPEDFAWYPFFWTALNVCAAIVIRAFYEMDRVKRYIKGVS